ncbi:Ger(x)C family spore germination protein [Clostridium lacusfryxellense]|uniref:Ger(x)C family spore germination protein n=1 Tax=Clostridium lacusfryxellense TaxID=205328 RepID=UPI001C0D5231|nr:Ger(x)C family spore germination protein [Clostridium lacusfryxellense]MBU3114355.1 Ger(x)C family spore germination protein [Clostridium lacusfryxellense]
MYRRRKKIFVLLLIIPFILCGCWDQVLVEKTGFMTIVGIETAAQGNLKLTYAMPVVDSDVTTAKGEIFDTEANLTRIARDNVNRRSGKNMLAGKIQIVLFSQELAGQGRIFDINSIFERDPSDAILAWVVVVEGSPRSLMHQAEENFTDKPRPSIYINALLERSVSTASTNETRIFSYDLISMAPGIDNIVPLIKINEKSIEVKGSALFSNKKMVGTINAQDNGLLMSMMKTLKHKKYTYNASIPTETGENNSEKQSSAIQLNQNSKKVKISIQKNKPVVDIYLDFSGYADEYKWDNLNDEKEIKKLNEHVQQQLQQDCQKLIGYMQKIGSDPIGIGDMIRGKNNSYFKSVDWHTAYKESTIKAHVKFNLVEYGDIQ